MDQEPDGFKRLERADGTHADFVPIFPLRSYIWGLFPDGAEGSGLAVFAWLLVALFWTPWVLLRIVADDGLNEL